MASRNIRIGVDNKRRVSVSWRKAEGARGRGRVQPTTVTCAGVRCAANSQSRIWVCAGKAYIYRHHQTQTLSHFHSPPPSLLFSSPHLSPLLLLSCGLIDDKSSSLCRVSKSFIRSLEPLFSGPGMFVFSFLILSNKAVFVVLFCCFSFPFLFYNFIFINLKKEASLCQYFSHFILYMNQIFHYSVIKRHGKNVTIRPIIYR